MNTQANTHGTTGRVVSTGQSKLHNGAALQGAAGAAADGAPPAAWCAAAQGRGPTSRAEGEGGGSDAVQTGGPV